MGYFDLNIPYPQPTDQSNRTRLAVKAMELGYTGIAYNRTIKGVMSDQHRCSIAPLTLTTLLNVLPSLSLSANLHRHLLGVPLSTPFRQYTRLTVCVDSPAQAQALNSANPILKTYDLVAVKPSNQTAFDLACQTMEVDIISIDFSAKLPFRLKHPMVKAATQRGVCFEVTYSGFFADIQIRRQLISSAKLLMDWTRGQNIVFSSAAPTVNELRGPCDVANLLSLFGLSKERANAAISKNCRILLANSLRKKRFYKEAIRVEVLSSDAASNSKEDQYQELLKWDPISSGEGDILLDDVQKSCVDSHKASKTAKAIDFTSLVNSLPSHGFEIKNILPANNALPVCPDNEINFSPVAEKTNQSTPVSNNLTEQLSILDVFPKQDEKSLSDAITRSHIFSCDKIFEKNIRSGTTEAVNLKEINIPTAIDSVSVVESLPSHEILDITFPAPVHDKHNEKSSNVNLNEHIGNIHNALPNEDLKIAEQTVNTRISDTSMEDKQFDKQETDAVETDEMQQPTSYEMKVEDDSTDATHLFSEVIMKDKKLGEVSTDSDHFASVRSVSGGLRMKRRTRRGLPLFPFKRLLNTMPFKKKGKKSKSRTKLK
uniref:Ribonuclease P protein subunit p30 n=1 Tax=Cajanus cajan TaxID=3821 RepID=A0A151SUY2_CAJCA|nr:Ribonuclease P protein subunit p30 [Cajanus cajan]